MAALRNSAPSPLLKFNLVNILYSYAFTMRFYNGAPLDDAMEAVSLLNSLCAVLAKNAVFETVSEALSDCLVASMQVRPI